MRVGADRQDHKLLMSRRGNTLYGEQSWPRHEVRHDCASSPDMHMFYAVFFSPPLPPLSFCVRCAGCRSRLRSAFSACASSMVVGPSQRSVTSLGVAHGTERELLQHAVVK